jgi:DNA-binding IclR family transcriptional regulator
MPVPVPAVERVRLVLDLLAATPTRRLRGSEIARATGIHRATCFSLLKSMAEQGLVVRDEDGPSYGLGPQLLRYGARLSEGLGPVQTARREMFALADELNCGAIVSARIDYEILTIDSIGVPQDEQSEDTTPGGRAPLRAPRGSVFFAWAPRAVLEAWLTWSDISVEQSRAATRTVAAIRARGYSLGADVELGLSLERLAQHISERDPGENIDQALYDLAILFGRSGGSPSDDVVRRISAPVFDRAGNVVLTLTVVAHDRPFAEPDVHRITARLLQGTRSVGAPTPTSR